MNKQDIKKIARLVVQSLLDKNYLVEVDSSDMDAVNSDEGSDGQDNSSGISRPDTQESDETIQPDPGQVLTADKIRNLSCGESTKVVIPTSTIVTDLALEEADKLKLEIVRE